MGSEKLIIKEAIVKRSTKIINAMAVVAVLSLAVPQAAQANAFTDWLSSAWRVVLMVFNTAPAIRHEAEDVLDALAKVSPQAKVIADKVRGFNEEADDFHEKVAPVVKSVCGMAGVSCDEDKLVELEK